MAFKIILGVVVATLIGLVVMQFIDPKMSSNIFGNQLIDDGENDDSDDVTGSFTIQGNVVNPGKYRLKKEGVRMEDLITSAGGVNNVADNRCYYLEATIKENDTYYIPSKYDETDVCGNSQINKVNVNNCKSDDLLLISGVGKVLSEAIVNYREEKGLFYTIEALMNVAGIGNSKFVQIRDYVMLHE